MKKVLRYIFYSALLLVMKPSAQAAGSLSGSVVASGGATVNLSNEGTLDWAHVGLNTATDFNHKTGANLIAPANPFVIDGGTLNRYTDNQVLFTWTGGTPTAAATNTTNGVYTTGGFEFTAPADTTPRVLKVYVGGYQSAGTLTAHLSDSSAPDYVSANVVGQTGIGNTDGNHYYAVYTLVYSANSAGQKLDIKWEQTMGTGNLTIQAATLAPKPAAVAGAPTGLAAVAGDARTVLSWNTVSGADSYNVKRSTTPGGPYTTVGSTLLNGFQDTGLTNGTTYYYVVTAVNGAGESANSNQATSNPTAGIDGTGLNGNYYYNSNGVNADNNGNPLFLPADFIFSEVDPTVNFDFLNGPFPSNTLPSTNNFTTQWTGLVKAQVTGPYVFSIGSDDGSRLYLDGQLIVDNYFYQGTTFRSSAPINLVAGSLHVLRVNYFEGGGGTTMYLRWSYPGQATQIIPQYALYPTYGNLAPLQPTAAGFYGQGGVINVGWSTSDNATSYTISRSTTPGGPYTVIASNLHNVNAAPGGLLDAQSYTDTTANAPNTTYYYVVDAINANGTTRSNEAAVKFIGGFNGTGLTGGYYFKDNNGNPMFLASDLQFTEIDPVINFDFVNGPFPTNTLSSTNNFAVRWTGLIQAPVTGTYTFYTASDDGSRLWIDGRLIVDNYAYQGTTTRSGKIDLVAGSFHSIRVQYFQGGGGATCYAYWSFPGQAQQIIPQYALFPTYGTAVPAAPKLTGLPGGKSATLNISEAENATSFTVYRSLTSGGPYTQVATVPSNVPASPFATYTATYTDTGLTDGTTYYYVVTATNANGTSGNSNETSVIPVPAVVGNGIGLAGFYYAWNPDNYLAAENDPLTVFAITPTVNFVGNGNSGADNPGSFPQGVPATQFTAVYTGQLLAPYTGTYTFQTNSDDGIQVTVNGQQVINNLTDHAPTIDTTVGDGLTPITLTAGQKYDIRIEYWNNGGGASCQLYYNPLGSGYVIIPQSQLFPTFTIAPDPATDLAAASGSQSILLTWSTPLYAASFNVLRSTTHGGPYTQIATGVTGNSYVDTTVAAGTTYYYVIQSVNNIGTSANSNEASAAAVAPFNANGDGLYGAYYHGGNLDFSAENHPPFMARIDPTINYNSGNTTGYNAQAWPNGVPTINFTAVWTGQFLAPYTGSYTFQTITDDGSRLSLDPDGNGLQVLFDDETGHGPLANTASPVNLVAGHKYPIKFEFTQGGGGYTAQLLYALNTAPFAIIPQSYLFSSLTTPGAPTGLAASANNAKVSLSWNFTPQALTFNVLRSTTHNGPYTQIASGLTSATYTDSGLTNGTTYYYVVQAVNYAGTSANSNEASATPSADTLVLHYTFENGPSGTDPDPITDVSIHGNTGRAIGGDSDFTNDAQQGTWAGLVTDNAHYIALPDAFDFGPQFTFFCWVKMSNDVSGIQTIVASNGSGGTVSGFSFYVNDFNSDSHDLVFETNALINGNNIQTKALSAPGLFPIGDGKYHAVACTVDAPGGKVSMYLDGVAVVTDAKIDNQWPTQSGGNTLGIFPFTLDELNVNAQFDDVRVYNVRLSAAQIAALSSTGPSVSGRIALEGVNDLSALSAGAPLGTFHVSFRTPGTTTEVFGQDVTLTPVGAGNPFGTFTVTGVPAGTYDVAIKGNKNLRVAVASNVVVSGPTTLPDTTLPAGDADNNNVVDIGDFGILVNAYLGDFNAPGSGYDPTADFNFDGKDDIGDFGLLVNEFGTIGAP